MFVGKYRILRSLNTAGTVTLAENTADGSKYVLKELAEESAPIYRRVSELPPQENLMQVHEILRQDGNITAVCEFAEGQPLDELLDGGRVFPISEIRRITAQLCRAAEHLHKHGIIHRDITPKNIILDENLNLKLIDLDIARLFSGNREQDTTLYGTEGFAPPEQYGFRETRLTADIYSIGMVLKLLLNGCSDCSPAQEVLLRKIAAKCTRFVPEKRYRSAGAVRRAVSRSRRLIPMGTAAASAVFPAGIIAAVLILQNISGEAPPVSGQEIQKTVELSKTEINEVTDIVTAETPEETSVSTTSATTPLNTSAAAATPEPATATSLSEPTTTIPVSTAAASRPVPAATAATRSASTTTATKSTTAEISEPPQPTALHTSDADNPNKIYVSTDINERGFYEDIFEYEFYDDPAVHGEWTYCNIMPISELTSGISADYIRNHKFIGDNIFSALTLGDNGESRCILSNGEEMPCDSRWTNGYLICEYVDGTAAQRLFEATIDGEEFLFVAIKNGDFYRENRVHLYEVYTRAE